MIFGTVKLTKRSNQNSIRLSSSNFYFILNYLAKSPIKIILIDPFVLDYLFIRQLSFEQLQRRLITFGVFNDSIETVRSLFSFQNISITTSKDHLFIEYNQQIIHLAILHEQESYFLIEKNSLQIPDDIQLSYGDVTRVIEP